ncbi:hypothetical protein L0V05_07885 [Tabrizicola sp. J26]|uniref:hypothetical protein n=1 Tax=Alitabrizicola rongguiensis TaxID=2909234 RepID=UPI001F3592D4|nr:hypothetical protein [Tabrizicola rongguiensis]MCF1708732.1 hypothetical protein [Tabrizicola rongguiensis]
MFRGVKDQWKKAEAATVIEILLERQVKMGLLDANPALVANKLVEKAWDNQRQFFDGRIGNRPHKISFAAGVMAMALEQLPPTGLLYGPVMECLCALLTDLDERGIDFPVTSIDAKLLAAAQQVVIDQLSDLPRSELHQELDALLSTARDGGV